MSSISIEGDIREFREQMDRLTGVNKRKLNSVLAQAMRASTLDRFKKGKDPEGTAWEESARVKDRGGKTLVDTTGLKKSIHIRSTAEGFAVGSNLKYAATHQYGAEDRVTRARTETKPETKVTIPARPYLGINDDDMLEIKGTIEDFLTGE